jgi:hypothetical protein
MPPIQLGRDTIRNLLGGETLSLDELLIVICEGSEDRISTDNEISYFDISSKILFEVLPQLLNELGIGIPTIVSTWEDSSICPASITFKTCNDNISLPLYDLAVSTDNIRLVLEAIPSPGDENFPTDVNEQDNAWAQLASSFRLRALGLLSSYLCRESNGATPATFFTSMFARTEDSEEACQVVITSAGQDGQSNIFTWTTEWDAFEEHDGPSYHTTWRPNANIQVTHRDPADNSVYFQFEDEDGQQYFRISQVNFDSMMSTVSQWGWSYSETTSNSTTMVSGNNNYGTVNQQTSNLGLNNQSSLSSPTPNIGPTQQQPGAKELNGIINGNVNVTGLGRINGIIEGDLNVPSGADIDVRGIVEGRIIINGGTVRLFGTAGGATISSGRFELYGILENSLLYSGGDVYYDPNSITG